VGTFRTVDAFYRNWVRTMHDVQLLGGDVSESERLGLGGRAPTVPADALLKGLPSPEGLPPRPPWFACNGHFAPTGKHWFTCKCRQAGRQAVGQLSRFF
jgi:hypothetical protein